MKQPLPPFRPRPVQKTQAPKNAMADFGVDLGMMRTPVKPERRPVKTTRLLLPDRLRILASPRRGNAITPDAAKD